MRRSNWVGDLCNFASLEGAEEGDNRGLLVPHDVIIYSSPFPSPFYPLVQLSSRLTLSPAALVAGAYGYSGPMERIRRAQAFRGDEEIKTDFYAQQRKIFEINPKHPLILGLLKHIEEVEEEKDRDLNLARVLYETTSIRSGFDLMDKLNFAYRVERVMRRSLGIDLETEAEYHEEGRKALRDDGASSIPEDFGNSEDGKTGKREFQMEEDELVHDEL